MNMLLVLFWFSPRLFVPLATPKIGCISKIKINADLFCILLDLHYLCSAIQQSSR